MNTAGHIERYLSGWFTNPTLLSLTFVALTGPKIIFMNPKIPALMHWAIIYQQS